MKQANNLNETYLSGQGFAALLIRHDSVIQQVKVAPEVLGPRHHLRKRVLYPRSGVVVLVRAGGVVAAALAPAPATVHRTGSGAQRSRVDVRPAAVALHAILQSVEDVVGGRLARVRAQLRNTPVHSSTHQHTPVHSGIQRHTAAYSSSSSSDESRHTVGREKRSDGMSSDGMGNGMENGTGEGMGWNEMGSCGKLNVKVSLNLLISM